MFILVAAFENLLPDIIIALLLPNCLLFEHISAPLLILSMHFSLRSATLKSFDVVGWAWNMLNEKVYSREKWKDGEWSWTWNRFWYHRAGGQPDCCFWVQNRISLLIDLTQDRPHTVDPKLRTSIITSNGIKSHDFLSFLFTVWSRLLSITTFEWLLARMPWACSQILNKTGWFWCTPSWSAREKSTGLAQ